MMRKAAGGLGARGGGGGGGGGGGDGGGVYLGLWGGVESGEWTKGVNAGETLWGRGEVKSHML